MPPFYFMSKTNKSNNTISRTEYINTVLAAIHELALEKKLPQDTIAEAIGDAVKKQFELDNPEEILKVEINIDNKVISYKKEFEVTDVEDFNEYNQINVNDPRAKEGKLSVGDKYYEDITDKIISLGSTFFVRVFSSLKYNVNVHTSREVYAQWKGLANTIIQGVVDKTSSRGAIVDLSSATKRYDYIKNAVKGFMPRVESIPKETLLTGNSYPFFIKEIKEKGQDGEQIILSRADAGLVRRLLYIYMPEIQENIIEIKKIVRIPGFKTKISLISHRAGVEAVGSIIGVKGQRIKELQKIINNERIEVIEYTDDFAKYLVNVCSPAVVIGYNIRENKTATDSITRSIDIITLEDQKSLLIGPEGKNSKLIARFLEAAEVDFYTEEEAKSGEKKVEYTPIPPAYILKKQVRRFDQNRNFNKSNSNNESDL